MDSSRQLFWLVDLILDVYNSTYMVFGGNKGGSDGKLKDKRKGGGYSKVGYEVERVPIIETCLWCI